MLILKPNRILDLSEARHLLGLVTRAEPDDPIVLDLTGVRESHDAALGLIVLSLARAGRDLSYVGLGNHQTRVVEYLGGAQASEPGSASRSMAS